MPDLPIDKFGQFPLLQFAAALLVIGGLALAVYRGTRDSKRLPPEAPEQRWFFDGPIAAALTILRDILVSQTRLVENTSEVEEEQRKQTDLLHQIVQERREQTDILRRIASGIEDLMPLRKRRN